MTIEVKDKRQRKNVSEHDKEVSVRLASIRRRNYPNRSSVAKAIHKEMSEAQYRIFEEGTPLRLDIAKKIANLYGISLDELYYELYGNFVYGDAETPSDTSDPVAKLQELNQRLKGTGYSLKFAAENDYEYVKLYRGHDCLDGFQIEVAIDVLQPIFDNADTVANAMAEREKIASIKADLDRSYKERFPSV